MERCRECGADFEVPGDAEEGELIECPTCATEYEIIQRSPLELALFEEDEK